MICCWDFDVFIASLSFCIYNCTLYSMPGWYIFAADYTNIPLNTPSVSLTTKISRKRNILTSDAREEFKTDERWFKKNSQNTT